MDLKDFPFKTSFSSTLRPLISEEKDKYLSLASLVNVGQFIPNIDTRANIDLLPAAFNACVINRANKNGDVIDTATALAIAQLFVNKPINIEHNRQRIIGVILNVGFSEFGTDKPLTSEEVAGMTCPFNMTMGAVLWRIVNAEITDKIEESGDPQSEFYQSISASWELGFSQYDIAVSSDDGKDLEGCSIITDEQAIASLDKYLKANGGTGKAKDGSSIFRKVVGKVVPLGIGLTENPAAEVKGIAVKLDESQPEVKVDESGATKNEEKISQSSEFVVNTNSKKFMKIESVEQINDTNWKEITASAVTEFIAESLKKANETFVTEKASLEGTIQASADAQKKLSEDYTGLKAALDGVQGELKKLQEEKAEREKVDAFNNRMNDLHATYALTDDVASVIASQVKSCTDDNSFATYKTSMSVFLKPYERKVSKAGSEPSNDDPKVAMKKKEDESAYAKETAAAVVDKAVDGAQKEKNSLPNSMETKKGTLIERFAEAFTLEEGFIVNPNRR